MPFTIEVLQDNGLFEIIEEINDKRLAVKWYQEWCEELPEKTIRLAEHDIRAVRFNNDFKEIKEH